MQSESTDSGDEGLEYVGQHHADYDPFKALATMLEPSASVGAADVAMNDFGADYVVPTWNVGVSSSAMVKLPVPCNADFM